jgi:DNA-binding Lrp family transcriptional regulator
MPTAFVFITTDPVSMPVVLKNVRAIEGVVEAEMVYGVFDIVAKVQTETMDQLKQVVAFKLRMLTNVLKTETLLAVLPE